MKKHIIYKTTNLVNGKIYIGCHKTDNLEDDYMGSGKILKRAIKKYGIKYFKKEIIQVFDKPDDMFDMEAELVNEEFVKDTSNYNLKVGGQGGFDYINKNSLQGRDGNQKNLLYGYERIYRLKEKGTYDSYISKQRENMKRLSKNGGCFDWTGKKHTEESKKKIGEKNAIHQKGKGNSQYGKCWVYNLELKNCISIKKEDIDIWLDKGYIKGRKITWQF